MSGSKASDWRTVRRASFLFRGLSDAEASAVCAQLGEPEWIDKGADVYTRQAFRRALGLVLSGELRVIRVGADGRRRTHNRLLAGDAFGAAALFGDAPADGAFVTEVVAYKAATVQFITEETLTALWRRDPRIAENYIRFLTERIRFLNRAMNGAGGGTAEEKLRRYLLSHCDETGRVTLPCSLSGLSARLDVGRSSLYRALEDLSQSGFLQRNGKEIFIQGGQTS